MIDPTSIPQYKPDEIEPKWQARWAADKLYETTDAPEKQEIGGERAHDEELRDRAQPRKAIPLIITFTPRGSSFTPMVSRAGGSPPWKKVWYTRLTSA